MHADEMEDIESAARRRHRAPCSASTAPRATPSPTARSSVAMTSMHVPEPVISLVDQAEGQEVPGQHVARRSTASRKEDPTFRAGADPESGETIISGMGELHLDVYVERMKREYSAEVETGAPQVAYRETISPQGRVQLHPQEADRRLGPVRRRSAATSSRCRGEGELRVRERGARRRDPDASSSRRSRRASAPASTRAGSSASR